MTQIDWDAESKACVQLLQDLLRIPTVNLGTRAPGDGNERPAAERIAEFLREANIDSKIVESDPGRANLIARIKGTGEKPPILLNAHLDVVEADPSKWTHDPFSGEISDGYIWGRGAIDMKHMAAMSACVMRLLKRGAADATLERDVIFTAVADEETGCEKGSLFLVENYADEVRAEYTLGELGGFSLFLFGRAFYPIQIAEKGMCWVRASVEGEPGHGSVPNPDSAVIVLSEAIAKLGKKRLPQHPVDSVKQFIEGMARELPQPQKSVLRKLTVPQVAGLILEYLIRDSGQRRSFGALLSNTASPTVVRAGNKTNVIPGKASVELDGRTLPGQTDSSFLAELREVMGERVDFEIIRSLPPIETPSTTPMFDCLSRAVKKNDALGVPLPFVIPGYTDAKAYAKLGTKYYGFAPVRFDPTHDVSFTKMYHGHDERVPVDGLGWGLRTLFDAVSDFATKRS